MAKTLRSLRIIVTNTSTVLFAILILLTSSAVNGDSKIYYTDYDDNTNEKCYSVHVGDKLSYQKYSGTQTLYRNGTALVSTDNSMNIDIVVTGIFVGQQDDRYSVNSSTSSNGVTSNGQYSVFLNKILSGSYFVYLDWDAWENMYNNKTQANIENTPTRESEYYSYEYYGITESKYSFTLTFVRLDRSVDEVYDAVSYIQSFNYNKTDGSLLSSRFTETFDYILNDQVEESRMSNWSDIQLTSKEKVSDETNCFIQPTPNSSDKGFEPVLNYIYVISLIPIIKLRSLKKKDKQVF